MLMILNVMIVQQSLVNNKVDSINFKNAIIQSQLPFELPEFEKDIEEMIIAERSEKDYGNLVIENYPNLHSIVVKNSFNYLYSLKICNCEQLSIIKAEDWAFRDVKNVIMESS